MNRVADTCIICKTLCVSFFLGLRHVKGILLHGPPGTAMNVKEHLEIVFNTWKCIVSYAAVLVSSRNSGRSVKVTRFFASFSGLLEGNKYIF